MKKYLVLFLILFFTNCNNYHKTSFKQLSQAFNQWYFISHPDNYLYLEQNNLFKKYDVISVNDYIQDLKRFKLELSQININNLSNELKIDYNHIHFTIHEMLFNIEKIKQFENNSSFYVENILNKLKIIYKSNLFSNFDKKPIIINIINESYSYLEKSKFLINNSINIKSLEIEITQLINLLNEIDSSMNIYIDNVEFSENIIKYEDFLKTYVQWIKENIEYSNDNSNNKLYNYLFVRYVSNDNYYSKVMKSLNKNINKSFVNLFDRCLKYYLIENDEPIWVDNTDSLNVIKWTLEQKVFSKKIDKCKYLGKDESNFKYNEQSNLKDSFNLSSCYILQQKDLNDNILRNIYNKVYNKDTTIYLNSYDINVLLNIFNSSINIIYFDKNDSVYEILFYLNLYHRYKEVFYQEMYLNSSSTAEDIRNDISENCFLNNDINISKFNENIFSTSYYKLNEFIIEQELNIQDYNYIISENILDDLINKIIKNNKIK